MFIWELSRKVKERQVIPFHESFRFFLILKRGIGNMMG
jgi:hypothetical protein